jgi:hypothetical protein
MQDRRYRPGDVLDDYCPRERRITDHAIVAMIDDEIRRTRCGSCDAEHEYKQGRVPAPRRKTPAPALFTQVLDNLNGSGPKPHSPPVAVLEAPSTAETAVEMPAALAAAAAEPVAVPPPSTDVQAAAATEPAADIEPAADDDSREQGGFRRSLIRATFPRPEGQAPPPRALPEFTIQSLQNRRNNNQRNAGGPNKFRGGGRRRPGGPGGQQDNLGPMRFRDGGHGQNQNGDGRPQGAGGGGRRRRGGKKNR